MTEKVRRYEKIDFLGEGQVRTFFKHYYGLVYTVLYIYFYNALYIE